MSNNLQYSFKQEAEDKVSIKLFNFLINHLSFKKGNLNISLNKFCSYYFFIYKFNKILSNLIIRSNISYLKLTLFNMKMFVKR